MIRVIFRSWVNLVNNSIFAFFLKNRSLNRIICRCTCKVCCTCCVACFRWFWISSRSRGLWINSATSVISICLWWWQDRCFIRRIEIIWFFSICKFQNTRSTTNCAAELLWTCRFIRRRIQLSYILGSFHISWLIHTEQSLFF